MDLFCGTGTIGQLIAKGIPSSKVIGVDIVHSAIVNARENAIKNGVKNISFYAEDAGKFLLNHPEISLISPTINNVMLTNNLVTAEVFNANVVELMATTSEYN